MRKNLIYLSLLFIMALILSSCGETKLIVKDNIPATIYVNGIVKGTGEAYIKRFGFNKTVRVKVMYSGYAISEGTFDREYDLKILIPTIVSCIFIPTAPISIAGILYQRKLPKVIEMELPVNSPWDQPYNSFWNNTRGSVGPQ